jgi:uncharacterized membrane protein
MDASRPNLPGMALLVAAQVGCSVASVALLWVRMRETGSPELSFLVWNLFLAWVPMVLAVATYSAHRGHLRTSLVLAPAAAWLLFLPNAPYVVTDLIHLGHTWQPVPLWFDVLLLSTFGGTGLLIGYSSLFLVHAVLAERLGERMAWSGSCVILLLSAVGICIGRIVRLNSWDAVAHPGAVFAGLLQSRLSDPAGHPGLASTAIVMTVTLLGGYLVFFTFASTIQQFAGRLRWLPARLGLRT